jgi:hypothetical protein
MATDPVLYAAINNLKEPIGAVRIVPSNFSSASYLDAGGIFKSSDYPDLAKVIPTGCQGTFFTKVETPFTNPINIIISDNGVNIIAYIASVFTNGQTNKMWASNDSGVTWTQSNWVPVTYTWRGIVADRNNGFVAWGSSTGTTAGVLVTSTSNDGITWQPVTVHASTTVYPLGTFFISSNNTWFVSLGTPALKRYVSGTWTTVPASNSWNTNAQILNLNNNILFMHNSTSSYLSFDDGVSTSTSTLSVLSGGFNSIAETTKSYCIVNYASTGTAAAPVTYKITYDGIIWLGVNHSIEQGFGGSGSFAINDCYSYISGLRTKVARTMDGITWDYNAPIYVDSVKNTDALSKGYGNFTKDYAYIVPTGKNYLFKSVPSTYSTYQLIPPATSTTPGTKIVVRAK